MNLRDFGGVSMDLLGIIKDAFVYPSKNLKVFVIVSILMICLGLFIEFDSSFLSSGNLTFGGIILLMLLIGALLVLPGYILSIIRVTINGSDDLPSIDLNKNIVDSLKLFVMGIVYLLPIVLILLFMFVLLSFSGDLSNLSNLNYLSDLSIGLIALLILVIIIICLIFAIFIYIAESRLAKYDSLSAAFQIKEILNDISNIGWGNYIIWFIILYLILGLLSLISDFFDFMGIIGFIISSVILAYIEIFRARNIGLIYRETEK